MAECSAGIDLYAKGAGGGAPAWSPSDLGASLLAWYKADVGVLTDGDGVYQWNDQSSNGLDVTQVTGSKKPQLVAAGQNGLDTISFDGIDDFLEHADHDNFDGRAGMTFAVATRHTIASNFTWISKWAYMTAGSWAWQSQNTDEMIFYHAEIPAASGSVNTVSTDGNFTLGWRVISVLYDGSQPQASRCRMFAGETELSRTSNIPPAALLNATSVFRIGAWSGTITRYLSGQIGEIVLANLLSAEDLTNLQQYMERWV